MSRYLGPRLRITRRLGHLSGLTRKKPTFKPVNPVNPFGPRKIIPPGQHGRNKSFKKKPYESCEYDYLIRLKLKQRLRFHYGLTEKQLVRYVQQAKKIKGSTGRVLLRLLEMRLDNIVFRLHMAPTIKAARQLISHGHILVNKKKVTIPSFQCQPKDIITVAPKIISMELVSRFLTEFDKEKSVYDRILKILEFGRKGVTMKLLSKNTKTFKGKYSLIKKELYRKGINSISGNSAKVQKLKIGTVLNVTIQNRGRKEAEAISYAFGKMIVIHPFFVGKQSLNKTVRVVIYKKSKNNKILYTYPANPFYLRLENVRKLNSLDVAKLFSNYLNQISYKFNKKTKSSAFSNKKRNASKIKINTSALILMNASKLLPKNSFDRRKRVIAGQKPKIENNQLNTERALVGKTDVPSVFIRIVAAKCLNKSKQNSAKLSAFLNSLKRVNPSFSKDPVAYREKYVYTKTSKVLRLFGTRFYAKILKNKKADSKNERQFTSFGASGRTNFAGNKNTDNRTGRKNLSNNQRQFSLEKKTNFGFSCAQLISSEFSVSKPTIVTNKSKFSNSSPFALKSSLSSESNFTKVLSAETSGLVNNNTNSQGLAFNTGLFKKYFNLFAKLSFLKAQKTVGQNVDLTTLKKKVLNTFLVESKKYSLKPVNMNNFMLLFFQKLSSSLEQKNTTKESSSNPSYFFGGTSYTQFQNLLLISKNIKTFWYKSSLEASFNSKQFSNEMLVFLLKLTSVYNNIAKTKDQLLASTKIDNLIKNNISLLFLLDKIKNNLENNFNFIKSFFSSDCLISSILPYFNGSSISSILTKLDTISLSISTTLLNLLKTNISLAKLTKIKNILQTEKLVGSEIKFQNLNQLSQNLVIVKQSSLKFNLDKFVNIAMVSLPKAVFLVSYEKIKNFNNSTEFLSKYLNSLSFDSVQNQKIILIKTLTFLKTKNLIKDLKVNKFKKVIKEVLQNQTQILSYLKNSLILNKKFKQLNGLTLDLNNKVSFKTSLQQKVVYTSLNQKILLLNSFNWNQYSNYKNSVGTKTNISLDILQRQTNLLKTVNLLKNFHLMKDKSFNNVTSLVNNHFSLVEKLQGLLTTIHFGNSLDWKLNIKKVLTKNFEKIDQNLASVINFWKLFKNTIQITDNFLAKENILQNLQVLKNQFSQNLLQNFFSKTDLAKFVKNSIFNNMTTSLNKDFRFILQLHKIMNINVLGKLNLLSDSCVAQMIGDVKEKFALKGLSKTNSILDKLLVDTKLQNVLWNQKIDLLALDNFLQLSFLNSSGTKVQKITNPLKDEKQNWKKVLSVLTPNKILISLKTLKDLNNFSSNTYDYLLLKLNNLYSLNKNLNVSLRKQYFMEKLNIIFKTLVLISKNFKQSLISLDLFANSIWGLNKIKTLSLQNQNELREVLNIVKTKKTKLKNTLKLQKEAIYLTNSANFNNVEKLNSLIQNYIENRYNSLVNKFLSFDLVPSNNSYLINAELNKITNDIKLFFKLQTLILESSKLTSISLNKNYMLSALNKELQTKLLTLLKTKQNFFTDMEYKQFNNTFKKLIGSSFSIKLSTNFASNLNQTNSAVENTVSLNKLQTYIWKLYKNSFIPVYYNFQSSFNSSFESYSLKVNKITLYKVLNNFKLTVNNSKISNLFGEFVQNDILILKSKSNLYQTFTNLALIENYVLCTKDYNFKVNNKQLLQNAKTIYLKQFHQNLKLLVYLTNLDKLKNTGVITDTQYFQFKTNYENIFKLVKNQITLLNVLNKRKKWNFINYGTYQNLVRSIYKNLTVKIKNLLQKLNRAERSSNQQGTSPKNLLGQSAQFEMNESFLSKPSFASPKKLFGETYGTKGSEKACLSIVQQTLEQLVNTSDFAGNNVTALVSNFVSRILLVSQEPEIQPLKITSSRDNTLIKPLVKETYKRLIAVHKKLELAGPWSADSMLRKTKNKQKTLILQNFVSHVKTPKKLLGNKKSLFVDSMYNKFIKVSLFANFLKEKTKNIYLLENQKQNFTNEDSKQISKNLQQYNLLLTVIENLQFRLQKDYLTKFKNGFVSLGSENLGLNSKLNLDLNNLKEFINFYNTNIQNQIYNTKFVFQSIFKHFLTSYTTQKFNSEFKEISKFQKIICIKNILFNFAFGQSFSKNSLNKIKISKLINDSLTIAPKTGPLFITSSNIEKLVYLDKTLKASISVSTVSNRMLVQVQKDIQKQKLRKTILSLKHLESIFSDIQGFTFNTFKYSTVLLDVLARLYDLKNSHIISERKYSLIKQKLKIFSLFLVLNEKVTDFKAKGLINSEKSVEIQKQIIQKINQKIKKAKTFSKFKYSLKSLNNLTKKGLRSNTKRNISALTSLNSNGRWSRVTLKQLVKQKLLNNKQEEKLNILLANQDNNKMKKLRRIISVLLYSQKILENTKNSNSEKVIKDVIGSVVQSFTGPWKRVLVNLLSNQNFKDSLKPTLSETSSSNVYNLTNWENNVRLKNSLAFNNNSLNNFEFLNTQTKVTKLLRLYYNQVLILRQLKNNRTIASTEFEQKFKIILGNIILVLEKGGLEAFKVIYQTKWINVLLKNNSKNSVKTKTNLKSQKNRTKRTNQNILISEFSSKYNFYKNLYFSLYKKSVLNNKIKLFHLYKKNLLNELLYLEKIVTTEQIQQKTSSNVGELLTSARLTYLKKQGIMDSNSKTYKKLAVMLTTSLQRLAKLDRLFTLQNLYMSTSEAKNTLDLTSSPNVRETLNTTQLALPFIKLKQKIIQSYLRFEYKQIEKNLIKQKLFVKNLNSKSSKKKQNSQNLSKTKLITRKKSKTVSTEQFNSFFQQLLNFLDSRYKSGGRNRRNPRINSIIRRLNQKLAFDKTLTKKFGDYLQKFIEKRFGPALPIPPHLELKRWKIKNAKLQSKQKANLKYLILPVGIVHDLAPRRSVGLPILERLIVEYYSRN